MNDESQVDPEWHELRTLTGPAEFVPGVLDRMLTAQSTVDATAAYWELDNHVVVQGQLFSAATRLSREVVNRICAGDYTAGGLSRAMDLLVELANGEPDESEVEVGNVDLGERCRENIAVGLNCIKALANSKDERTILGMLEIVDRLESDPAIRTEFFSRLPSFNWSAAILRRLRDLR